MPSGPTASWDMMGLPRGPTDRLLPHSSPTEEEGGCPPLLLTQVLQLHGLAGDVQGPATKAGIDKDTESLELGDLTLVEVAANADALVLQVVLALHNRGPVLIPVPQGVTGVLQDPTRPQPPWDLSPQLPQSQNLPTLGLGKRSRLMLGPAMLAGASCVGTHC